MPEILHLNLFREYFDAIVEAASGSRELAKVLARLGEGDVLMVTRLDRLARSTRDLLNVLDQVSKAGAGFKSLGDPWADTTTPGGRLMLTVIGGIAEFERELIRARTGEGRARARERGVHLGRHPTLTPTAGGARASRGWRGDGRHREDLQREPLDDQPPGGAIRLSRARTRPAVHLQQLSA
jgi:DNA invertase Pin-like site-specific DNA recombinase